MENSIPLGLGKVVRGVVRGVYCYYGVEVERSVAYCVILKDVERRGCFAKNSVRLFVCISVCTAYTCIQCDKQERT